MKRIEHFCDRCGCKLEEHRRISPFSTKQCFIKLKLTEDDFNSGKLFYEHISDKAKEVAKLEHNYAEIQLYVGTKEKTLELCGKCRKDFEEFMKNV